jgi:AcrR family transcriptional regulator
MLTLCRMDQESKKPSKADRTRAAILAAAQKLFAGRGYELTTVRDIAAMAEIDPALVIRYFGSKEELFARAAVFNLKLPDLGTADRSKVGEMLVRHFLSLWEGENANGGLTVLLRSAASNKFAANKLQEIFATQVLPAITKIGGQMGAAERAGLIASQLLGLAFCRYVVKFAPVVGLSHEQIIREIGQTIQRYATGEN